jgi:hypothetical protein
MGRYLFALFLLIHGLIHLIGFYKYARARASKAKGMFWLTTTLLFITTAVLTVINLPAWWLPGIIAVGCSQVLITNSWSDAKYGTIINAIVLAGLVIGFSNWSFAGKYYKDLSHHFTLNENLANDILSPADLQGLPDPVQRYLRYVGAVGKPKVTSFKVELEGHLRQSDTAAWMPIRSEQYNFMREPTRLFFLRATMKGLPVAGYHRYVGDSASMDIRLLSMATVAEEKGAEIGISETVTFFNDMCVMAPATLIDPRIKWLQVDGSNVLASFSTDKHTVSAWLYFNDQGQLTNFVSNDRYARHEDGSLERLPWSTPLQDYKGINGHKLATYADVIYQYPEKEFCYGKFKTINIEYNPKKP